MISTGQMHNGLVIQNLSVYYGRSKVVDSLSISVANETAVLFGPSGCGKTSILKAILGVRERGMKVEGSILLDGKPIEKGSGTVGMLFQGPIIPTWMKVYDLCKMGCNIRRVAPREQKERIMSILSSFGIDQLAAKFPYQLSGGEKQRVALALALVNRPKLLLMDEPTTFIDGMTRIKIWDFFEKKIQILKFPILIVSHDPPEAITLGDKIYVLSKPAVILDQCAVPFSHPRSEKLALDPKFWELRDHIERSTHSLSE